MEPATGAGRMTKEDKPMRSMLKTTALAAALAGLAATAAAEPVPSRDMTVYKTPWCGCCHEWAELMGAAGFNVVTRDLEDLSMIKKQAGVPAAMESCHTAAVDGYVIEGHVPAGVIDRLLSERPDGVAGLAVPGMPQGSPGMGSDPDARYDVYALAHGPDAAPSVYHRVGR